MIGRIYGIYHKSKLIYIGSTFETIHRRLQKHKSAAKYSQSKTNIFYCYLKKYEDDEFTIALIIEKEFENKSAMLKTEGDMQDKYNPPYNTIRARGRTKAYYEENTRLYKIQKEYKRLVIKHLKKIFGRYLIYYIETQYSTEKKIAYYKAQRKKIEVNNYIL